MRDNDLAWPARFHRLSVLFRYRLTQGDSSESASLLYSHFLRSTVFLPSPPRPFPAFRAMRLLPDPLTCSTGCFPPTTNVPKALIRSDIWFPDGNIVLIAGSAAFRVHRGQLERHSEVFRDLFLVGRAGVASSGQGTFMSAEEMVNEEGNKMVDGCPTVDVYDCPSDVYHLFVALYDGLYFPKPHARDFSVLSSVLRLSTKYFIEHLRTQCLARLAHDWPATLADWDKREAAATDANGRYAPRDAYAHPVLAINLAFELGLPDVLPSAFYDLSRYGPSRIVSGARALPPVFAAPDPCAATAWTAAGAGAGEDAAGKIHLSQESLVRTLRGRELAQLYVSTFLARALEHRPSAACLYSTRTAASGSSSPPGTGSSGAGSTGSSGIPPSLGIPAPPAPAPAPTPSSSSRSAHCTESFYFIHLNVLRSVGGIACGRDADPLYTLVQAAEMVERKDFSDGVRTCGLKMCGVCKREWKGEVGRAREEVWGLIPVWFGLRDGGAAGRGSVSASALGEMELEGGDTSGEVEDIDVDVDINVDELGE